MGALTDLSPLVRRKCPGIMDLMMLDALADAYKEFCESSEYLIVVKTIPDVKEKTQYDIMSDSSSHNVILDANGNWDDNNSWDDLALWADTGSQSDDYEVLKVATVVTDKGNGHKSEIYLKQDFIRPSPNSIVLRENHSSIDIKYIKAPKAIADPMTMLVDDEVINRYGNVIAFGAAMRLRLMPAQPWTEPNLAEVYSREFTEGIRKAYRDRREQFTEFRNQPRKHQFF